MLFLLNDVTSLRTCRGVLDLFMWHDAFMILAMTFGKVGSQACHCLNLRLTLLGRQVRLMPTCCFVLLRFWLRVDGVIVRLRETRFLCDFESRPTEIVREVLHYEAGKELMAKAGSSDTRVSNFTGWTSIRLSVHGQTSVSISIERILCLQGLSVG